MRRLTGGDVTFDLQVHVFCDQTLVVLDYLHQGPLTGSQGDDLTLKHELQRTVGYIPVEQERIRKATSELTANNNTAHTGKFFDIKINKK